MAKPKNKRTSKAVDSNVKIERSERSPNFDFQNNRSVVNLVLGAAVLVVLGIVLFNFLSNQRQSAPEDLGPSQQTENTQSGDVAKESLPGKYTVKEGDSLFSISQKYYDDGYKYTELVKANKIANENNLEVGLVLDIPKLEGTAVVAQASPVPAVSAAPAATSPVQTPTPPTQNTGNPNQTTWGEKITTDTYTVKQGDKLTAIAGRAYGDPGAYLKIAQTNNIRNSNRIEAGMVLKIPRTTSPSPSPSPAMDDSTKGGEENQTMWGEKITTDTYTVKQGDKLTSIAGRAYGNVEDYKKIAQANNISNPNLIEVGMVLKIPR